jgi:dolichyl-phosphate-mannose-protein mannosyltransferase
MSDVPESRAAGDLSVVDAWRLLVKPVPSRPAASYVGIVAIIVLLNLSAIATIVAAAVPDPTVAAVFGLLHTAVIPGALLAFALVPSDEVDVAEWLVLAFGFGIMLLIVGGLSLALLPVRFGPISVFGWTAIVTLAVSAFAFRRGMSWKPPSAGSRAGWVCALLVAVFAAGLRLPGLGYSEFQGDETEVILRATGVVQDLPDALFYHGKGPGEIVVVAIQYGLRGALAEGTARLPFALVGVGGAVAFYLVARRLVGTPGAVAAGLLIAANGYFLAFSRITQYQSVVLLLGTLGLWCALRWSQGGRAVWPPLAGALVATATLAHYDAIFVLPPIALLAVRRLGWRGLFDHTALSPWFRAIQIGAVILALFFVPYLDNPLFGLASGRIGDRVGAGFPHNNLPSILASATLYLGTVFPALVLATIVFGLVAFALRRAGTPAASTWMLAFAWVLVPLLFYACVARKPGTHIHVATSGLMLMAGAGIASLWSAFGPNAVGRAARIGVAACFVAGLGPVTTYLVPVYLQTTAEIVRENKVGSLPLAWKPPGGLPTKERFGFPYQAGWKTVGAMFADGTLTGSYDSNEQPQVTYWYTRGVWRCSVDPRYYLIAENVQDEIETPKRTIDSEYHPIGTVTVAGEPKLRVFERGRAAGARPTTWPAEEWADRFNRQVSRPTFDPGPWARGVVARESVAVGRSFGEDVDLLGYQVYAEDARPGGVVRADLFWLPQVSSRAQHRIDVQLGDDARIGDASGPACDKTGDDQDWSAGRPFAQRVSIPIAAGAAPGSYPLLVSVSRVGAGGGVLAPAGTVPGESPLLEIGRIEVSGGSGPAR